METGTRVSNPVHATSSNLNSVVAVLSVIFQRCRIILGFDGLKDTLALYFLDEIQNNYI